MRRRLLCACLVGRHDRPRAASIAAPFVRMDVLHQAINTSSCTPPLPPVIPRHDLPSFVFVSFFLWRQARVEQVLSPQPPQEPLPLADYLNCLCTVEQQTSALFGMLKVRPRYGGGPGRGADWRAFANHLRNKNVRIFVRPSGEYCQA